MNRLLLACAFVGATSLPASAQSVGAFDPEDAVAPISIVEGPGVRVGEGTVLHPIFGLETGFVSNVFYQDTNEVAAGMLRLMAQIGAGSLPLSRLAPPVITQDDTGGDGNPVIEDVGDFQYRADLRLSYDALLSGNDVVRGTGGLGAGATFRGLVNPLHTWSFGFNDDFHRLIRAANFETDADTNRDINYLYLRLFFQPKGRNISGVLMYDNTVDVFEQNTQQFADRFMNIFGLRGMYQWLPVTRVALNVFGGVVTGIGTDTTKATSYPLKAYASLETLLSLRTTLTLHAGVNHASYSVGDGFTGPLIEAQLGYRYSPLGRFTIEYDWVYADSVNANYYRDHLIRGWVQQAFVPFVVVVQPEVHFRQYVDTIVPNQTGGTTRDDVILSIIAGVHYNLRNWWAFTADYKFSAVQTDFRYMASPRALDVDPSYARHELLFGTRIAM